MNGRWKRQTGGREGRRGAQGGGSPGAATFFVLQDVGGKATLISHVGGILPIFLLDDILQVVVNLCSDAHGLPEVFGPNRKDHKLLHGQLVASVRATVDDIESLWGERSIAPGPEGLPAPGSPQCRAPAWSPGTLGALIATTAEQNEIKDDCTIQDGGEDDPSFIPA